MARTVNRNQTLEEFRNNYNALAGDVGTITGLAGTINNNDNLVDAINEMENRTFYFDSFTFTATASQTTFESADENDNKTVKIRPGRFQVFQNANHLIEGDDFTLGTLTNGVASSITLNSGASASDTVRIYTFTGSVLGDGGGAGSSTGQFTETAANSIYNINSNGVILNGDSSSRTTVLESGYTLQLAGKTFAEDDIVATASGKKVQFPIISDGTAQFTGGVGTGFSSITSTNFVGDITGDITGDVTGDVKHSGSVVLDASTGALTGTVSSISNHAVSGLSDVNISSPTNGQVLVYNTSNSRFQNQDPAAVYTDEDAQDAAAVMITSATHTNITVAYDDATNTLAFSTTAGYGDSDVQSYLSGGAGLALSGSGSFSVNTSNGVKIDGDDVELDYEIVSTAPSGVGSTSTGHLWFVI